MKLHRWRWPWQHRWVPAGPYFADPDGGVRIEHWRCQCGAYE